MMHGVGPANYLSSELIATLDALVHLADRHGVSIRSFTAALSRKPLDLGVRCQVPDLWLDISRHPLACGVLIYLSFISIIQERSELPLEEQIASVGARCSAHSGGDLEHLADLILDCVMESSPKITVYAALISFLLRNKGPQLPKAIFSRCALRIDESLRDGRHGDTKILIRYLCALAAVKVGGRRPQASSTLASFYIRSVSRSPEPSVLCSPPLFPLSRTGG